MTSQCYGIKSNKNGTYLLASHWVPCGNAPPNEFVSCCSLGDLCLSNNLCYREKAPGPQFSNFYAGRCTDPKYKDPSCRPNCRYNSYFDVVYNGDNQWQCCQKNNTYDNTFQCRYPKGQTFKAQAPAKEVATVSLPKIDSTFASVQFYDYLPTKLQNLRSSNSASFTAVIRSEFAGNSIPTWLANDPNPGIASYFSSAHPITYTDKYLTSYHVVTGKASASKPTAAGSAGSAGAAGQGGPNPTKEAGNGGSDSNLGVEIGVPIAAFVVIVAAIVAFLFWRRRRKQQQRDMATGAGRYDEKTQTAAPYAEQQNLMQNPHHSQGPMYSPYDQNTEGGTSYFQQSQKQQPSQEPVMLPDQREPTELPTSHNETAELPSQPYR